METEKVKIKSFTDLVAWQEGHKLALMVYKSTTQWPREEIFGLTSQVRRAAVSITSNIAEGFSRRSWKDKSQFYFIALGSVTELQNQLLLAKDLKYFKEDDFKTAASVSVNISKLINGLIKSLRVSSLTT